MKKVLIILTVIFAIAIVLVDLLLLGVIYNSLLPTGYPVLWILNSVAGLTIGILIYSIRAMSKQKKEDVMSKEELIRKMDIMKDDICAKVAWNDIVKANDKDRGMRGNVGAFRAMIRDIDDPDILLDYLKMVTNDGYSRYVKFIPTAQMQWTHIWSNSDLGAAHYDKYVKDHNLVINFKGERVQ